MSVVRQGVHWNVLQARRASAVGVLVDGPDEASGCRWLRPAPWIAVGEIDVEPWKERLVAENRWLTTGQNIDYGRGLGLCDDIQGQQERLVRGVLEEVRA